MNKYKISTLLFSPLIALFLLALIFLFTGCDHLSTLEINKTKVEEKVGSKIRNKGGKKRCNRGGKMIDDSHVKVDIEFQGSIRNCQSGNVLFSISSPSSGNTPKQSSGFINMDQTSFTLDTKYMDGNFILSYQYCVLHDCGMQDTPIPIGTFTKDDFLNQIEKQGCFILIKGSTDCFWSSRTTGGLACVAESVR